MRATANAAMTVERRSHSPAAVNHGGADAGSAGAVMAGGAVMPAGSYWPR